MNIGIFTDGRQPLSIKRTKGMWANLDTHKSQCMVKVKMMYVFQLF